jgi:hypothetical protein
MEDTAKGITGEDHAEGRDDLDKYLVPGRQGPEIVEHPRNQDQDQRPEAGEKTEPETGFGGGKVDHQGKDDEGRGKPHAPEPRYVSGVDLSFVDMVIPGIPVGKTEDQGDGNEGKEKGRKNNERGANHAKDSFFILL